jgi:hypothetical protein
MEVFVLEANTGIGDEDLKGFSGFGGLTQTGTHEDPLHIYPP